jgi:hypothetical protein
MYAIEFEAEIENGIIRIPADHPELANGRARVVVLTEAIDPVEAATRQRDERKKRLLAAYDKLAQHNYFPDIDDPVAWQRRQRDEWDRDLTSKS